MKKEKIISAPFSLTLGNYLTSPFLLGSLLFGSPRALDSEISSPYHQEDRSVKVAKVFGRVTDERETIGIVGAEIAFISPEGDTIRTETDKEGYYSIDLPVPVVTSVEGKKANFTPEGFILKQNYPNPFNPSTVIEYSLPKNAHVRLYIYNSLGQVVRRLVEGEQAAGRYSVGWAGEDDLGRNVSSGVYFSRLEASDFLQVKKMVLLGSGLWGPAYQGEGLGLSRKLARHVHVTYKIVVMARMRPYLTFDESKYFDPYQLDPYVEPTFVVPDDVTQIEKNIRLQSEYLIYDVYEAIGIPPGAPVLMAADHIAVGYVEGITEEQLNALNERYGLTVIWRGDERYKIPCLLSVPEGRDVRELFTHYRSVPDSLKGFGDEVLVEYANPVVFLFQEGYGFDYVPAMVTDRFYVAFARGAKGSEKVALNDVHGVVIFGRGRGYYPYTHELQVTRLSDRNVLDMVRLYRKAEIVERADLTLIPLPAPPPWWSEAIGISR